LKTFVCYLHPVNAYLSRSSAKSKNGTALLKSTGEGDQRFIAIKYSVRGRDLGGAVEEAIKKWRTD